MECYAFPKHCFESLVCIISFLVTALELKRITSILQMRNLKQRGSVACLRTRAS